MDWWLATFLLGALLSLFLPIVPTIFYVVLCLAMSIMAFLGQKTRKLSVFFLGIAWVLFNAANYQYIIDQDVPLYFKGKSLAIGQISNIAQVNDNGQRFDFIISKVGDIHLKKQIKVRLSWKNTQTIVEQNQLWQFFIKVKPAHGLANVGGFSYKTWLRKNGIHATGYIVKSERNALLKNETSSRQDLYNKINSFLPVHSLSPLILALTFGERGQLTKSHWQVLQNTATQHLIAISGLHLGLIASGSYFILSWFMRLLPFKWLMKNRIPPRLLLCNYQVIVISLSCLTTLLYAYFAGFSIPTLRALIMLSLFWEAKFIGVKLSVTRWLLISVFIIVLSVFNYFDVAIDCIAE